MKKVRELVRELGGQSRADSVSVRLRLMTETPAFPSTGQHRAERLEGLLIRRSRVRDPAGSLSRTTTYAAPLPEKSLGLRELVRELAQSAAGFGRLLSRGFLRANELVLLRNSAAARRDREIIEVLASAKRQLAKVSARYDP